MKKKFKPIPKFRNEDEEAEFWTTHDFTDYIDISKAKRTTFSHLKLTTKSIPIRFPVGMIERLKIMSLRRGIPYQSLIKIFLAEKIEKELPKF